MSSAKDDAVYNSRIAGMLTPSCLRGVRVVLVLPILLLAATAYAQNWDGAEEQLAAKIVALTGPRTIWVEVSNRPSSTTLSSATFSTTSADDIRRGLVTRLAALGARFVKAEEAAATVRVSLSENLQSYVWVAEIHLPVHEGSEAEPSVVMVSVPRLEIRTVEPKAVAMVLHKTPLWSQAEQILDIAVVKHNPEGNPAFMLVLDSLGVGVYRLQDGRWQAEQSLTITHSRPWPRDLRGRLELRKDHLFDAYLPGVFCRSTAGPSLAMACYEGNDAWPIGTNWFNLNAAFVSSRNYFSGALLPGMGKEMTTAPFYSAAVIPQGQSMLWFFAAVDGQVHLLDGATDQVMEGLNWGSDIASVRSGCGFGWQILATGNDEGSTDTVRAFEVSGREPIAASPPLELQGSVTGLWSETSGGEGGAMESGESGAMAVVHDLEKGGYEAFRLTPTCGR
jgi:hypothetical protein